MPKLTVRFCDTYPTHALYTNRRGPWSQKFSDPIERFKRSILSTAGRGSRDAGAFPFLTTRPGKLSRSAVSGRGTRMQHRAELRGRTITNTGADGQVWLRPYKGVIKNTTICDSGITEPEHPRDYSKMSRLHTIYLLSTNPFPFFFFFTVTKAVQLKII